MFNFVDETKEIPRNQIQLFKLADRVCCNTSPQRPTQTVCIFGSIKCVEFCTTQRRNYRHTYTNLERWSQSFFWARNEGMILLSINKSSGFYNINSTGRNIIFTIKKNLTLQNLMLYALIIWLPIWTTIFTNAT